MPEVTRVKRESFLRVLEMVSPALQATDTTQQSSCFVFTDGWVITFNGDICCQCKSGLPKNIDVALKGKKLLSILNMVTDEELDLEFTKDTLYIDGKGKTTEIHLETEVIMPVELMEHPDKWNKLPEEFTEAVKLVEVCTTDDDNHFDYTCIHLHPDFVEASSSFRAARYTMDTGIEESCLVSKKNLVSVIGFGMILVGHTDNWIHFKNPAGLIISCVAIPDRNYHSDSIAKSLQFDGEHVKIPKSIKETARRADVFISEWNTKEKKAFMTVEINNNLLTVTGRGNTGAQIEDKKVKYTGKPITFGIPTDMLMDLMDRGIEFIIAPGRVKIDRGNFQYISGLEEIANGKAAKKDK